MRSSAAFRAVSETRAAEELGASELERIDVGGGERVPLLADVLAWAASAALRVNIELKSDVRRPAALLVASSAAVHE